MHNYLFSVIAVIVIAFTVVLAVMIYNQSNQVLENFHGEIEREFEVTTISSASPLYINNHEDLEEDARDLFERYQLLLLTIDDRQDENVLTFSRDDAFTDVESLENDEDIFQQQNDIVAADNRYLCEISASAHEVTQAIEQVAEGAGTQVNKISVTDDNISNLAAEIESLSEMTAEMNDQASNMINNIEAGRNWPVFYLLNY